MSKPKICTSLVIGVGTTGNEIVQQIKADIQKVYGEIPPIVKFLVLETRKTPGASVGSEYRYMPVENAEDVVRLIDSYSDTEWFPKDMVHPEDARDMERGAGRIRALGRLSLWANVDEIEDAISYAFGSITDDRTRQRAMEKYEIVDQIYIYIVGSLVGGTGGGILIDVAYLVRNITTAGSIKGIFMFPFRRDIPSEEDVSILNANTYSTLKELDYFMDKKKFTFPYGRNSGQRIDSPPFDFIYLVDEKAEDESISITRRDAIKMIATFIETEIGTAIGVELDAMLKNIREKVIGGYYDNRGKIRRYIKAYNTFSTSSLIFPAERISDVCAYRFMTDFLGSLLEKHGDAETEVKSFLSREIGKDGYSLNNPYKGLEVDEEIKSEPKFDARSKELINDVEKWAKDIENALINKIYPQIDKLKNNMSEEIEGILREKARELMQRPSFFKDFLNQLKSNIKAVKDSLDKDILKDEETIKDNKNKIESYKKNLEEVMDSRPYLGRKRDLKEKYEDYVTAVSKDNEKKREVYKKKAVRDLYLKVLDVCGDENKNLLRDTITIENLITRMRSKGMEMDTTITNELTKGHIGAREKWIGVDKIGEVYEKYKPDINSAKNEFLEGEKLYEWVNKEVGEIFDKIFEYSVSKFEKIREVHIVDFLDEWYKDEDIKEEIGNLIIETKPFWRFTLLESFFPQNELKSIHIIGINDLDRSEKIIKFAREIRPGVSPIDITDKHKIISTQYKYGLPIVGFRGIIERYKNDYNSKREKMAFTTDARIDFPEIDKEGPTARIIDLIPNPTSGAKSVILKVEIDDSKAGNSPIVAAEYFIDKAGDYGSGTPLKASDERFDSPIEMAEAEIDVSKLNPGKHMIFVRGKDAGGNWGDFTSRELEVT